MNQQIESLRARSAQGWAVALTLKVYARRNSANDAWMYFTSKSGLQHVRAAYPGTKARKATLEEVTAIAAACLEAI